MADATKSDHHLSVGFVGAGMMASAVMDGIVAKGVTSPGEVICSDLSDAALALAAEKGYATSKCNQDVCRRSKDAIVIGVKPGIVNTVCKDIMTVHDSEAVIISVAAGVTLETLEHNLPGRRVVRIMPNTPCLVGQGASGFMLGVLANSKDRSIVQSIFGSVGLTHELKQEYLLNAVTGLSGSGPAYVFQFIEALADGGVRSGLPREQALQLAAQTVKGAAEMVLETGKHPGELKDRVCSPGGTTIAGCDELEKGGFRAATIQAVKAATRRSFQLGGMKDEEIANKYNL